VCSANPGPRPDLVQRYAANKSITLSSSVRMSNRAWCASMPQVQTRLPGSRVLPACCSVCIVSKTSSVSWQKPPDRTELDHVLDLASGGSSAVRNLFPQPNVLKTATGSAYVHNDKDRVEAYTFHALRAGKVTLAAVQQAMTSDWTTAVKRLGLPMIPAGYTG